MFNTWHVFDNPELTRPFLEHIAVRLRHHGDLWRGTDHDAQKAFINTLRDDADRRRKFLLALCACALSRIEVYAYRRAGLLLDSDLEWLLSIAPGGSGLNAETLYNLIDCAFVIENVAHFDALYAAAERWPELRARYAVWFDGVRLDSPGAAQAREQQEQLRALENDRPPPDRARPGQPNSRAAGRSRSRPLAGLVAAHLLFDADAGKPGFRGRTRLFHHHDAGMGRSRRVASAPHRRFHRTIPG
jgi:hypothetical protein